MSEITFERENKEMARYTAKEFVNYGRYGEVFTVRDNKKNGDICVKVASHVTQHIQRKFKREFEKLSEFDHPNIIKVYDFHEIRNFPMIFMEKADNDVRKRLEQEGKLSPDETVHIISQVGDGISQLHMEGTYHRDIKASHILLFNNQEAKISDFGDIGFKPIKLSKRSSGGFVGTMIYKAPEVFENRDNAKTVQAEVYSLGYVVHQMLTNKELFVEVDEKYGEDESELAIKELIRMKNDTSYITSNLSCLNVDRAFVDIIKKCLQPNPNNRYSSVLEMISDLEKIIKKREHTLYTPSFSSETSTIDVHPGISELSRVENELKKQRVPKTESKTAAQIPVSGNVNSYPQSRKYSEIGDVVIIEGTPKATQPENKVKQITTNEDSKLFNAFEIYTQGCNKFEKKDFDGAIKCYDEAIKIDPDVSMFFSERGHAKHSEGDLEGAINYFKKAIDICPTDKEAIQALENAEKLLKQKTIDVKVKQSYTKLKEARIRLDWSERVDKMEKFIDRNAVIILLTGFLGIVGIYNLCGYIGKQIHNDSKPKTEAVARNYKHGHSVTSSNTSTIEQNISEIENKIEKDLLNGAKEMGSMLKKETNLDMNRMDQKYFSDALDCMNKGNYKNATDKIGMAIEANPNEGLYYLLGGYNWLVLKEYSLAIHYLTRSVDLTDKARGGCLSAAYSARAMAFYFIRNYDKSIEDINKLKEYDRLSSLEYILLTLSYKKLNQPDQASNYLSMARKELPNDRLLKDLSVKLK